MNWTPIITRVLRLRTQSSFLSFTRLQSTLSPTEPLKIAFFGSDEFSVASLNKLHQLQQQQPTKIDSIHVITRSIKPKGRGLKIYADLPIGTFSTDIGIPILRADTSTEILDTLKQHEFSIAIAVSYGKLIPGKFIKSCKYGGLNVHPSVLPKYSGSAPLQYALINDDQFTGCTVQTLHPSKFDHGDIILQKGEVPIRDEDNYISLRDRLGEIGGELLAQTINQGLYLKPAHLHENLNHSEFSLASKIPSSKSQALWDQLSTRQIKRLYDALGPLFTFIQVDITRKKKHIYEKQRVILSEIKELKEDDYTQELIQDLSKPGDFTLGRSGLIIRASDGYVSAGRITMQAQQEESPERFLGSYNKKVGNTPKQFLVQDV
ncbi:FMT1 [[Candida] subhashii]|uniref:FMT1 n=1 Tax=[Candida] subhashii TaxID=561895 RepID=A0A8J5UVL9_9ASCO|nr:FMT1 [[Candida] subhashii]KAG7661114.1 FMT1 [[Candida] subhashii]